MPLQHWIELVFGVVGIGLLYYGIKIEAKAEIEIGQGGNQA
jgi:hypothetical protein